MKAYDLIVIGAGPGGYEAAFEAADLGMKTALVEKEALGGTCLNHGCIPTKSLLHAAGLYRSIREADLFGISAEHVALDFARMQARKNEVVLQLRKGIEMTAGKKKIDLFRGKGTLQGGRCVLVKSEDGEEMLEAQHILLAPGSRPALPPIPGIDLEGVVTSDELLEAEKLPQRLVIIGGGVIGVEFASVFAALGTSVTVIEAMGQLLPSLDREIAQSLKMLMKKRGVKVLTDTRVQEIRKQEDGSLSVDFGSAQETADLVLVSVGRRPYTEGLFAPGAEPEMDRGVSYGATYVTDSPCRIATVSIGYADGYYHAWTSCVGMTLDEAKAAGLEADSRKVLMSANGKTVLSGAERGYIRVVFEKESGKLLGAQMMCERASDIISEFTQALSAGMTAKDMARAVRPHPTFSEAVTEALRI